MSNLWNDLRSAACFLSRPCGIAAAGIVAFAIGVSGALQAQPAGVADRLVSSWILVAVDKQAGSETPVRARAPRGLLVLDGAGNVFEFFSAAPTRAQGAAVPTGGLLTLEENGGF